MLFICCGRWWPGQSKVSLIHHLLSALIAKSVTSSTVEMAQTRQTVKVTQTGETLRPTNKQSKHCDFFKPYFRFRADKHTHRSWTTHRYLIINSKTCHSLNMFSSINLYYISLCGDLHTLIDKNYWEKYWTLSSGHISGCSRWHFGFVSRNIQTNAPLRL